MCKGTESSHANWFLTTAGCEKVSALEWCSSAVNNENLTSEFFGSLRGLYCRNALRWRMDEVRWQLSHSRGVERNLRHSPSCQKVISPGEVVTIFFLARREMLWTVIRIFMEPCNWMAQAKRVMGRWSWLNRATRITLFCLTGDLSVGAKKSQKLANYKSILHSYNYYENTFDEHAKNHLHYSSHRCAYIKSSEETIFELSAPISLHSMRPLAMSSDLLFELQ